MATKNQMIPVSENFNLDAFCEKLSDEFRSKGYNVVLSPAVNGTMRQVTIEKDNEGIKNFVGLGTQEEITFSHSNNTLIANYNDGCQTMRFVSIGIGWFLCFIPFITGIIGLSNHSNFLKNVQNSVMMTASQF